MKKQVSLSTSIGKIIQDVHFAFSGQALIMFSDGTFAALGAGADDDCASEVREETLNISSLDARELIRLGIGTEEEIASLRDKKQEEKRLRIEAEEIGRLKYLLNKYGAKSPDSVCKMDGKPILPAEKIKGE